jgi:8-oxo-dGTP pyrophosphatase MutT (NUDIX family)
MKIINTFISENITTRLSVKGLVRLGDHYLILRIREGNSGSGYWDLPGGGVENNEETKNAIRREIFEETNLTVSNIKQVGSGIIDIPEQGTNVKIIYYECDADHNDVILKPAAWKGSKGYPEHTEYKWIEYKKDLENLPMLETFKDTLMKKLK